MHEDSSFLAAVKFRTVVHKEIARFNENELKNSGRTQHHAVLSLTAQQ